MTDTKIENLINDIYWELVESNPNMNEDDLYESAIELAYREEALC
tara:strand:- start:515 stop:649 length:135 start_codon:yes stop_codon:yes gene_type:complete